MYGYKAAYAAKETESGKLKCAECIISLEILGDVFRDNDTLRSQNEDVRSFAESNMFRTNRVRVVGIHDKNGNTVREQCVMTIPACIKYFAGITPVKLFRYAVGEEISIPGATPTNSEGIYFFRKLEYAKLYLTQIDYINKVGTAFHKRKREIWQTNKGG